MRFSVTKSQLARLSTTASTNFRSDVNLDGTINSVLAKALGPIPLQASSVATCGASSSFKGKLPDGGGPYKTNQWIDVVNGSGARVVAADVPSGLSAQTGHASSHVSNSHGIDVFSIWIWFA